MGDDGYEPEFCDVAASMCARGATIADLASEFKVHRATIYRWMARYPRFCDAIRVAREVADERVGFSLYERAVGYTYNAVKIMQFEGQVIREEYLEHVPPDVGAVKHWQAVRRSEKWKPPSEMPEGLANAFVDLLRMVSAGQGAKVISG